MKGLFSKITNRKKNQKPIRNRSLSRNRILETSFDTQTFSSTEDLDEPDRLSNYPILRQPYLQEKSTWKSSLKKSVSETGQEAGQFSIWNEVTSSASNQGSPPVVSGLRRSKGMLFNPPKGLPRSNTVNVHLNSSPVSSAASATNSWNFNQKPHKLQYCDIDVEEDFHSQTSSSLSMSKDHSEYIIQAIIETHQPSNLTIKRESFTPQPKASNDLSISNGFTDNDNILIKSEQKTPPNTAPLSSKFERVPQNLLKLQNPSAIKEKETLVCSSTNSSIDKFQSLSIQTKPLKLSLRDRLEKEVDSSSAESTPQKKPLNRLSLDSYQKQPSLPIIRRGAEIKPSLPPKPNLVFRNSLNSKFFSSGESSCSSGMSSLESIRSNASESLQSHMSSESGATSSMSSYSSDLSTSILSRQSKLGGVQTKFTILSPISDKSQEQYSEHGDPNKTPKASPSVDQEVETQSIKNLNKNNNFLNDNDDIRKAMNVPWEMPKLKNRLNNLNQQFQGSDSGISTASQQEVKDLLNVPWDMPKLRKKTLLSKTKQSSRPLSLPNPIMTSNVVDHLTSTHLPPPPGFEDTNNESCDDGKSNKNDNTLKNTGAIRKQRPNLTLSFKRDTSLQSLMFATDDTKENPFNLADCEEIDPNIPLECQEWYHGIVSFEGTNEILRSHQQGEYLVRRIDQDDFKYSLAIRSLRGFMHMGIYHNADTEEYWLCDFTHRFKTIPQMIDHYTKNKMPIKGAEYMCLKKPIKDEDGL